MKHLNLSRNISILSLLFVSLIVCLPGALSAQTTADSKENSADVLTKMGNAIDKMGAMELKFVINMQSDGVGNLNSTDAENYTGSVEIQGSSFKMVSPDFEIFCDGISKWILNVDSDELTIFPNDTTQIDMVENPVGFLRSLASGKESGYKYSQRATLSADGTLLQVELTPSRRNSLCKNLIISVKRSDYLPYGIVYNGADGSGYKVEIAALKKVAGWSAGNFIFPENRMRGLQVTDLR